MNDEYLDSLISLLVNIGAEEYTVIANVSHVFGGGGGHIYRGYYFRLECNRRAIYQCSYYIYEIYSPVPPPRS